MSLYVMVLLPGIATLVILVAASPAGSRTHDRSTSRRRRYVERNPCSVNSMDIRNHLIVEGVPREQAVFITELAAEHQINPLTMWMWLRHFDARSLGVVVAADVTQRELVKHIENGTVPNIEELKVFAGINGLPIAGPTVVVHSSAGNPGGQRRNVTAVLPEIFEPGEWPEGVLLVPSEWSADAEGTAEGSSRLGDAVREAMQRHDGDGDVAA